jgi:hypothetical protein
MMRRTLRLAALGLAPAPPLRAELTAGEAATAKP